MKVGLIPSVGASHYPDNASTLRRGIARKPAPTAERINRLMAFPRYRPPGGGYRAIFVLLNI
jgi:hypothetical protein